MALRTSILGKRFLEIILVLWRLFFKLFSERILLGEGASRLTEPSLLSSMPLELLRILYSGKMMTFGLFACCSLLDLSSEEVDSEEVYDECVSSLISSSLNSFIVAGPFQIIAFCYFLFFV